MNQKKLVIGILAHVDAGKTTLAESILYGCKAIRKLGRVDHKDAFLDTYALEKARGITIFSKQALFQLGDVSVTLLDTPGHVDFSAEMERTLSVLDYAVLVISGTDGVQGHVPTLWKLLKRYHVPVFLFINKMDQAGTNRGLLMEELQNRLDPHCIEFDEKKRNEVFEENLAVCDDVLLERYLEGEPLTVVDIAGLIRERKVFPCYFGSALRMTGVEEFLHGLERYTICPEYPDEFSARVFKISRDAQGNRLTHLKVTGGVLRVKQPIGNGGQRCSWHVPETLYAGRGRAAASYCVGRRDRGNPCAGYGCGTDGNSQKHGKGAVWHRYFLWNGTDCVQGDHHKAGGRRRAL